MKDLVVANLYLAREPPRPHPASERITLAHDAFHHLPHLRDRVTPADQSLMRITPEVLALFDERGRAQGYPEDWRHSDEQRDMAWRAFFHQRAGDLWIFGYGSLMWDPGVHFVEVRLAEIDGYQRRFTLKSEIGRGAPGSPALMLSLERLPGLCRGLVFRVAADLAEAETQILWRREMIAGSYAPEMASVSTPQGDVTALVFASNVSHRRYVGELPLDETAAIIATGAGVIGTNRAYLEQMAAQLTLLGIDDPYVARLMAAVKGLAAA